MLAAAQNLDNMQLIMEENKNPLLKAMNEERKNEDSDEEIEQNFLSAA